MRFSPIMGTISDAILTEIYYRPAVVLTRTDDMATGSARSVSGFDVYKAIENCRDLLENFGGHTYAAGLSMKVENVPAFIERFEEFVSQNILPEQTCAVIDINAEIDFRDITPKFISDLKKFNPFGPDNAKPIFIISLIKETILIPLPVGEGLGERLSVRLYVFNLQLHFTPLMGILFNGIADVEGTFGLDEAYVGTLPESDAKPIFCTHNVYDYGTSKVVGRDQEHIKLELVDNKSNNVMNGIAFRQDIL